ncbi:Protein kinase domain [Trypanosoma melophagium]|uniref:Protein kinase domain n=1 Tax=Trypanosoma melophagium TaxID=715481 RepID=UPI00351A28E1|nr:Protein kinase domain [Trypanosoma melophagium]
MRVRRSRAAPAGFSIALPPPDISDELQLQLQQKNELLINVDDTSTSPIVTTDEPLFPARFFHVNNTNLFVLMNGVSMFTEGKAVAHKEENVPHCPGDVRQNVMGPKTVRKPQQLTRSVATVDSVEAAIRGIEDEGNDMCVSSTPGVVGESALVNHKRCTSASILTSTTVRGINVGVEQIRKTGGRGGKEIVNMTANQKMNLPKEYVELFSKGKKVPSSTLIKDILSNGSMVSVKGFVPIDIISEGNLGNLFKSLMSPKLVVKPIMENTPPSSPVSAVTVPMVSYPIEKSNGSKSFCSFGKMPSRVFSAGDVGRTNRSLDLDAVVTLCFIGRGSQGTVHRVMLDDKLYALKCIDVRELIQTTDPTERQGRKRGLVKELNMIRLQRTRPSPEHLMQMFNAAPTLDNERQQLHILMELMSFSVEDAQRMVSRFPANEMMKMTQSTFRKHLAGSAQVQNQTEKLLKQQSASCMHLTGRSSYNTPEDWETNIDRQTPVPEIILSMLAADVLKGLRELHENYSIVHCDLKPANVLLDFDKMCFKLADFGCGCQMDSVTRKVRRTGVDLGSKLYKAPERLTNELDFTKMEDDLPVVEFTAASDVWSLGIMLLELSNGVNPCYLFKSDYWNYVNNLKLSRMVKPLSWSAALHDFIVRCLVRDPAQRWPVHKLLQHPFILRYSRVPRGKLKTFMERLKSESETFQRRQQRELLQKQILLSTGKNAHDKYQNQSRSLWKTFTGFLNVAPQFEDTEKFPRLS